jgi:hypothetical protein
MKARTSTLGGYAAALFALTLLVLGWREILDPAAHMGFPVRLTDTGHGIVVASLNAQNPSAVGISVGDPVDISGMDVAARIRLLAGGPVGTKMTIRLRHHGVWVERTIETARYPIRFGTAQAIFLATATLTLGVLAFIVARRPSLATMALVLSGGGVLTTLGIVAQFTSLPDVLFTPIAATILAVFSEFPVYAVMVFLTRFPRVPTSPAARLRMRIGDTVFFSALACEFWVTFHEPLIFDSWFTFHNIFDALGVLLTLAFALAAYRESAGEDRQRIGWVLAGIILTQTAILGYNSVDALSGPWIEFIKVVMFTLQTALPVSLAYAILRYRVIDLGFVLNRTLVYAVVTAVVVVAVSFVDWLSGKLISETRLALAAEALVTIGLGVALNAVHGRIERLVDRVIFRARYIAERKLRNRLDALAFVSTEAAVDSALTDEIVDILRLQSAAVFRITESAQFARVRSIAWNGDAETIDADSLLVRAIRATGKPFFLADLGVTDPSFPTGDAAPILAVPIERQHDFIGFALYGREHDGTPPDPEIIAHLGELAAAAATTYELVEARSWRERYHELRHEVTLGLRTTEEA